MFITHQAFELPFVAFLSAPGTHYHRAVELSLRAPWFLVTFLTEEDGIQFLHSFLCSWDSVLVDVLIDRQIDTVVAVQQIFPLHADGRWGMRAIRQVWSVRDGGTGERVIVLQAEDGQEFDGMMGAPFTQPCDDRKLIAQVGAGIPPVAGAGCAAE
ncbi:MAG: hypothetical protein EPO01_21375 [Aquabacterium sp.]|nr:MAG: hypothetical protein EPO01_21375 [Aquabacterium sp.]